MIRLRDNLNLIDHPREAGQLAEQVPDTGGCYFVTVRFCTPHQALRHMRAGGQLTSPKTRATVRVSEGFSPRTGISERRESRLFIQA